MARLKAIFIGRKSIDSGYLEFKKLANRFNLILDEFINEPNASRNIKKYDFSFAIGYLTVIESLMSCVPTIVFYHNELKYDYHILSPYIQYIKIFQDPDDPNLNLDFDPKIIKAGQKWAKTQTWAKVANLYEELWKK